MRSVDPARLASPISEIVARIVHTCAPERIVLFGSYGYGTQTGMSDIDFLVVCHDAVVAGDQERRLRQALAGLTVDVDLVLRTPEEMEEGAVDPYSIIQRILASGLIVYEH